MPTYGLEFLDIYTRIKDYANINNVSGADTKAKRAANDALRLIATLRNWEQLKRESTITPVASQQAYTLASDFDHIISCWYISNGTRIPIDVVDDVIDSVFFGVEVFNIGLSIVFYSFWFLYFYFKE